MNAFLANIKHPIAAALEQPVAILENHHAAVALALLKRPELDFLDAMDRTDRAIFLKRIKSNVLQTDVSTTLRAAAEWAEKSKDKRGSEALPDQSSRATKRRASHTVKDFRKSITQAGAAGVDHSQVHYLIIKAADISNPARHLDVYSKWIEGVMSEFAVQGDYERKLGMTISMNCDRTKDTVPKAQVGFISFLVAPLFDALYGYCADLQPLINQLESNKAHFAALVEQTSAS